MSKRRSGKKGATGRKGQKLSMMVLHRTQDTMELVASVKRYTPALVAALVERYAPNLSEGETLPDYGLALELVVRDVTAALARLVELDDEVAYAAVDHMQLGHKRKSLAEDELYPRAVAVRGAIEVAFGKERGGRLHGIKGRTERKAPALERQLRRTVYRLTDPERELPPRKNPYAVVDRAGWIRQLEPRHRDLINLNSEFGLSGRRLEGLVIDKREAMKTFDIAYTDGLRYVRACFKSAGFDTKLLKNLKPYYRRRRLSKRARKVREARAAATVAQPGAQPRAQPDTQPGAQPGPEDVRPSAKDVSRVAVPKTVAKWLDQHRLFGT